ncbi:DUF6300 family protein [Streptomyces longwoodensis]|uniref:DUF6300 family protein n=1 Tax=Streptomyces longwoodensis TaxID=68231 RepID=UPI00378A897C
MWAGRYDQAHLPDVGEHSPPTRWAGRRCRDPSAVAPTRSRGRRPGGDRRVDELRPACDAERPAASALIRWHTTRRRCGHPKNR